MTRAEKATKAQELRAQGLTYREIGEQMGFAIQTVHAWLSDPDRSREVARKRSYGGTCADCGGATDGSNGRDLAPERCRACQIEYQHEARRWTPETIVEAIQAFHAENGRVPTTQEWMAPERGSRFPCTNTVIRECGRWSTAIRSAGFESYKPNMPDRAESATRRAEIVRRYLSGQRIAHIARDLDLDSSSVYWHLDRADVDRTTAVAA